MSEIKHFHTGIPVVLILLIFSGFTPGDEGNRERIGSFRDPQAFAIDPAGAFYVIDAGSSQLVMLSPDGKELAHCGGYGWSDLAFDRPADVIAPNGLEVYVADYGNHRVQRFDRNLNFISSFSAVDADGRRVFGYPRSIACSDDGSLYIIDGENQRIVKVSSGNTIDRFFGDVTSGPGRVKNPSRVRIDDRKNVYVLDGDRILVYDPFGVWLKTIHVGNDPGPCALEADSLYLAANCSLFRVMDGGKLRLMSIPVADSVCTIRDIAVRGGRLFVLTNREILGFPITTGSSSDTLQ